MTRNVRFPMLAVAALLVAAAMGAGPPSASAIQCCYCDTGYTTYCWSAGSSCAEAEANAPGVCSTAARQVCQADGYNGACQISTTITSSCWYDSGMGRYVYSAYATHGCKWCEDCGPILP